MPWVYILRALPSISMRALPNICVDTLRPLSALEKT